MRFLSPVQQRSPAAYQPKNHVILIQHVSGYSMGSPILSGGYTLLGTRKFAENQGSGGLYTVIAICASAFRRGSKRWGRLLIPALPSHSLLLHHHDSRISYREGKRSGRDVRYTAQTAFTHPCRGKRCTTALVADATGRALSPRISRAPGANTGFRQFLSYAKPRRGGDTAADTSVRYGRGDFVRRHPAGTAGARAKAQFQQGRPGAGADSGCRWSQASASRTHCLVSRTGQ